MKKQFTLKGKHHDGTPYSLTSKDVKTLQSVQTTIWRDGGTGLIFLNRGVQHGRSSI